MINTPTHIFAAKLNTVESIRDVLDSMTRQSPIQLDEVYALIQMDKPYYVVHNINRPDCMNKQYQVQGDSLSIFIQDYIEPGLGDGLDMHVFPENGEWCLIFDIDGSILFRS